MPIPGATNLLPGAYSDVVTDTQGVSVSVSGRVAALIGEGSTDEVLVSAALGGGKDGLNSSYTSNQNSDSRHFQLSLAPLVENRTKLFKNGVPLSVLESTIDSNPFSSRYDARVDPETGRIELQTASLVDQGGANYTSLTTNIGVGSLSGLALLDVNASTETWTIRCVSVQRDSGGLPIAKTARFLAFGSVSGTKLDANGNPIIWVADGYTASNSVLSFAIVEDVGAATPFRDGDAFVIKVKSGALSRGDSLSSNYIGVSTLNDPVYLQGLTQVVARHGSITTNNTLSLAAQLAFANQAPGVLTVQAAPAMPRRVSYDLVDSFKATSTSDDDFLFALPYGVVPNLNSSIHFFETNLSTGIESQVLPNKYDYYQLGEVGKPSVSTFTQSSTSVSSGGYSYSYTVIEQAAALTYGLDGYVARVLPALNKGVFSTTSLTFDASYVGKTLKVIDATNVANNGSFVVDSVSNGKLYFTVSSFADFTSGSGVTFAAIDPATGLVMASSSGTDGVLTASLGTGTATLSSTAVAFDTALTTPTNYRLRISGSATNNGLYDITSYNSGTDTLTISKSVVIESGLRYEVLDSDNVSSYVVVNKNVVPTGHSLRVTLIDDRDAAFYDPGWINALESLEAVECDIVTAFPKQTISAVFQNVVSHCKAMSSIDNRKERVAIIGAINGLTPDNLTGVKAAAVEDLGVLEGIQGDSVTEVLSGNIEDLTDYSVPAAYGSTYRVIYMAPDQIVVNVGGQNTVLDGFYQAGALAGYYSAQTAIATPTTNKILNGYTIPRSRRYSTTTLKALTSAGVFVCQPVAGGGTVKWGLTTTQSGFIEEREASIVFIRDNIAKTLRASYDDFVGQPDLNDIQASMQARLISVLSSMQPSKITQYKNPVVRRDPTDPTTWLVSVKVMPVYGVNFVYIQVAVGQI